MTMDNVIQKQWEEIDKKLYKVLIFKDFQEAFAFMVRVAFLAEKNNHHPRWTNEWNKVEIWLSTHDAGDIVTEKDRNLAREINELLLVDAI
ncbi:4a-hydroxytetrahydrobiopterin dehydratase [Pedobacter sp. PLR]|uniref:4a-hydroxytetrahydrobiopterin dehydratase n=1 Tax=Pedobacter sp. PLR TaxID=2994465 RepID=UPI0022461DA4|nr:4a-hydroxytetrahydrobiopterin dehydratase [Pedobacter sp. PLR]MCX2454282.1 4a-hydroxytetrahydrobiopterin dehydratase [Pedobacter sp. PLR]